MDRRSFLKTSLAATACLALPPRIRRASADDADALLVAAPAQVDFLGASYPQTDIWAYNGTNPGPALRFKQGERMVVDLTNHLAQDTTIHWHGIRPPLAMDGVPYLTQPPVTPGETFRYEIEHKDAGTFWYHPHVNSAEQVGRGLAGPLIIEEQTPPKVDRDLTWMIDDWRIGKDGQLASFGGNLHDAAHAGRLGNFATINGQGEGLLEVAPNERLRLRLINVANARIFALTFEGHKPWRIAVDGHPVEPAAVTAKVVIPPGGRVDLLLDMTATGHQQEFEIKDSYYQRYSFTLAKIKYKSTKPLRAKALSRPEKMAANPVAEPDLDEAQTVSLAFAGGAMGRLREAYFKGKLMGLRELAQMGMVWAVNGEIIPAMTPEDPGKPILDLSLGKTYQLRLTNDTAFDHPIHLHGHAFHLLALNGKKLSRPEIMDTVLVSPGENADIAFVADNPGDWAFHCHVLEHAKAGMMGYIRVS